MMTLNAPIPDIVPTPTGGLQLEWHTAGIDLEVEIGPEGHISACYEDAADPEAEWEGDLGYQQSAQLNRLIHCIDEIERRAA
jgi:hypothetical protein